MRWSHSLILVIAVLFSSSAFSSALYRASKDKSSEILFELPKIELHAHLHGSIRIDTLSRLSGKDMTEYSKHLDLHKCFTLFGMTHGIISNKEVLREVISETLEDYQKENTVYLELRTTPRNLSDGTTRREYLDLLLEMLSSHNDLHGSEMLVKLVISINRDKSLHEATEAVNIAVEHFTKYSNKTEEKPIVVGIDFSGNPHGGRFEDFLPLLNRARNAGLKVTVHTGEVPELSDDGSSEEEVMEYSPENEAAITDETSKILQFKPDRLGHALHLSPKHVTQLLKANYEHAAPGIEICPTSNFITLGLKSYSDHPHLRRWIHSNYPISINTDDRGIFHTSLTEELLHVQKSMSLSLEDVIRVVALSLDQTFASESEEIQLKKAFWQRLRGIVEKYPDCDINPDLFMLEQVDKADRAEIPSLYTM